MEGQWNGIETQCRTIQRGVAQGASRKAYQLLITSIKTGQHETSIIEDSNCPGRSDSLTSFRWLMSEVLATSLSQVQLYVWGRGGVHLLSLDTSTSPSYTL